MRGRLELVLRATVEAQTTARSFLNLDAAALNVGVMCTIGPLR